MRPILWGLIGLIIGMIGWVYFSVIAGVSAGVTGETDTFLMGLVYLFGMLFFFSIPVAVVAEIVGWIRKRKSRQYTEVVE